MWEHNVGGDSRRWCEVDGSGRTGGGVAAGGGSPSGSGAGLSTRPCSGGCGPPCVTTRHVVCVDLLAPSGRGEYEVVVVRAGSPAKPYEVVLKLDAKRPSDARLTFKGGRPVEFHLARHSAGRPPAPPTRPWPSGVTLGSFGRRRVGRVHAPCAVPRHPTATRTDTSSRRG